MADGAYWDRTKETRSRAEREAEVLANLQRQLHDVYERLPFYRAHYDKHGFKPEQVRTLDDFAKRVPIIAKPMLRDDQTAHGPFGRYLGCEPVDIIRVHGSSGTSGKPTLYAFSRARLGLCRRRHGAGALYLRRASGRRGAARDRVQPVHGRVGGAPRRRAPGRTAFPLGAGETERQLDLMHRIGATVLVTTPTYALHMLETARSLGYDTVKSPLRLGIFIGEPGSSIPGTRQALERGWGIKVRDMATTRR